MKTKGGRGQAGAGLAWPGRDCAELQDWRRRLEVAGSRARGGQQASHCYCGSLTHFSLISSTGGDPTGILPPYHLLPPSPPDLAQ